ncbi:hypothetical protein CspeluHIS016_0102150 [Cutaneotrichosporon spelunceum]|uniref:Structural maintenance of chromosomes protein n=1 Tax=Cutaneotrichosporon spelunceum TaxID=1672016 RepID=A0AAD3TNA8_9TREE|nr:hypothetical protein CspeluHIS016_0102150 [Cutaneotrichosporon spelunceum]
MHIKTITIQGFKSYRDQVAVDPFSPRHNVVVGRNGSGKSNFFAAIRFVLSDAYTTLSREERQRLLHEGTSTTTTLSAYVEIVFDNADGRFPTGQPELYLRRTIGLKKDEYSLDRKSVTKAEVMNLLESAGFSRSNPYYIVPQGRITHLTNISDKDRLNLLKEVAGTKVYEQKRAESTRIMEDTDSKREKIAELLSNIETRLDELETEKDELKEFQGLDRDRRCLEYSLQQRELDDITTTLDQLEEDRLNGYHEINEQERSLHELESRIQEMEDKLTRNKHSHSTSSIALQHYESEMEDLVRTKTEVECIIADFQQAGENNETRRRETIEQLESLDRRVKRTADKLVELNAALEQRTAEERQAKDLQVFRLCSLTLPVWTPPNLGCRFSERDAYLTSEVNSLDSYAKLQQKTIADKQKDVQTAKSHLEEVSARSAEQQDGEEGQRETLKKMGEEQAKLKIDLDSMKEKRKELWREDGKLSQSATNAKSELDNAQRVLQGMMDKDTSNGLRSVRNIARRLNLNGVYGPVYELFEVSDKYKTAVETVAGTSLFHVVVDSDDTASKLIDAMNKERSGRVTFMPLNRLKSVNVQYPKANDAVPLMSKLTYDRAYQMAFEQIFGRTVVCSDLATAAQYTRSHGLNGVTDSGDRVDRKGALTGGYHDNRRSRLDAIKQVKRWSEDYERDATRHTEVKDGLAKLEQQISQAMGEIQRIDAKRKAMVEDRGHQARQGNWMMREVEQARQRLARLEGSLADDEASAKAAMAKKAALEEELQTPLQQQLSPAEVQELETLSKDAEQQKKTLLQASQNRQQVASERSELEIELTENLRRRRNQLRAKLDDLDGASGSGVINAGEVEQRKAELNSVGRSIDTLSGQIQTAEEEIEALAMAISEQQTKIEELHTEANDLTRAMLRIQKSQERYLSKKQTLDNRKEECEVAIRDLGVLPDEAFTKYTGDKYKSASGMEKLVKLLHKVNDGLRKFAHVNKKAFEQYNNFTKQRDELLARREELDQSAESIQDLIQTLDQRKDEAIERTFKQVSKYFEEVFEQLVPAGRGRLIMQKRNGSYLDEDSEPPQSREGEQSEIDSYTGVSIKVSFNSKEDEGQRISQLSGGQKSLVALATVFAIQKCDPAPFYLFDEIDANLDTQYRTSVANMIHALSDSAQFITTTFRSEMLVNADKFYGVYFDKQKVSTIQTITQDEAQKFIDTAAGMT